MEKDRCVLLILIFKMVFFLLLLNLWFNANSISYLAQICAAVVYCLLAAGVIFGYAALKPILIKEGVYRDRCTKDELGEGVDVCYGQEIRYAPPVTHSFQLHVQMPDNCLD